MNHLQLIENYSERSFIVVGQTKEVRNKLKELGGKFNPFLKIEGKTVIGWVFSITRLDKVKEFIHSFITPQPVTIKEVVKSMPDNFIIASLPKIDFVTKPEVKELPAGTDLVASFIKKAGKKYANQYIELCKEANICVRHAITNSIMRRKLYQFKTALEVNQEKNRKKEYHKPVQKEQPFKCRLIVTKNGDVNTIETTFKNSSELDKFKKRMEKEADEQYCSVSFKYELI